MTWFGRVEDWPFGVWLVVLGHFLDTSSLPCSPSLTVAVIMASVVFVAVY